MVSKTQGNTRKPSQQEEISTRPFQLVTGRKWTGTVPRNLPWQSVGGVNSARASDGHFVGGYTGW